MTPIECEHEADVLCAVVQSRWPERVDAELRAHVAHCQICADVTLVASAIGTESETLRREAQLPDSGRVWWHAQLRARREAVKNAGRPITAAQVLIFAAAMGLLGACFGATSAWFQTALRWLGTTLGEVSWTLSLQAASAILAAHGAAVMGIAALVLIVPVAVYLAIDRE